MGFAGENQILVSRSFHDVASCLSEAYRPLFTFGGVHRDEQMREHAVYELHHPGKVVRDPQAGRMVTVEISSSPIPPLDAATRAAIEGRAAGILGPIAHHLARAVGARASTPRELGQTLAAFMPESRDREEFLRACAPPPAAQVATSVSFDAGVLERASRELASYLGPVARILVSRTSAKATSEEELYDLLSAEIQSPKDRDAFRKKGPAARQRR